MKEVIKINLDVTKIDKSKIMERSYTNKEGVQVVLKEYPMELVPLKEDKVIKQGDTWTMKKKYFLAEAKTKEEREAGKETNYLGDGIVFENTADQPSHLETKEQKDARYPSDDINPDDIPF